MAFQPLMAQAQLHAATIERPKTLLPSGAIVLDRMLALAALARALDPSIPQAVRFVKRGPRDPQDRLATPFRAVFTSRESDGTASEVLNDPSAQDFWQTLEKVLPKALVDAERKLVETGPRHNFASAQDAAVYEAYKKAHMRMVILPTSDPDHVVVATGAVRPPLYPFLRTPELGRALWGPQTAPVDALPPSEQGFLGRVRQKVRTIRAALEQPYKEATPAEREQVFTLIQELDRVARPRMEHEPVKRGPNEAVPTFEYEQQHGWIGFALSKGHSDWVGPLLTKAQASPHTGYAGVCPLAWAIAHDDTASVKQLLSAGASPNGLLHGWPKVYDPKHQNMLNEFGEQFVPMLSFAAAVGAAQSAHALIAAGAEVNGYTDYGRFPLMFAALNGDERMIRMLVANGADLNKEDREQRVASEALPSNPEMEALFNFMEHSHLAMTPAAPTAASLTTRLNARRASRDEDGLAIETSTVIEDAPARRASQPGKGRK